MTLFHEVFQSFYTSFHMDTLNQARRQSSVELESFKSGKIRTKSKRRNCTLQRTTQRCKNSTFWFRQPRARSYQEKGLKFRVSAWTVKMLSPKDILRFRWKLKQTFFWYFWITSRSFKVGNIFLGFRRIFELLLSNFRKVAKNTTKICFSPYYLEMWFRST